MSDEFAGTDGNLAKLLELHSGILLGRWISLHGDSNLEECVAVCDRGIALTPQKELLAQLYLNRATAGAYFGNPLEAIRDIGLAIALEPSDELRTPLRHIRGFSLAKLGRFNEAVIEYVAALGKITDKAPQYSLLVGLGYCNNKLQKKGKDGAEAQLSSAISIDKRSPLAYAYYGDSYAISGSPLEARGNYELAIKMFNELPALRVTIFDYIGGIHAERALAAIDKTQTPGNIERSLLHTGLASERIGYLLQGITP